MSARRILNPKRLTVEIEGYVQPLRDHYQFIGRDAIVRFFFERYKAEKVTYQRGQYEDIGSTRMKLKNPSERSFRELIYGMKRTTISSDLVWLHSEMGRLVSRAQNGARETLTDFRLPDKNKKYTLPNNQSLDDLIEIASMELLGVSNPDEKAEIKAYVASQLNAVKKPSSLVARLNVSYGFNYASDVYDFLSDISETPFGYLLRDLSSRNDPSNQHRKMFAVAVLLDYALKDTKTREYARLAIMECEKKRRDKQGKSVSYLGIGKKDYIKVIEELKSRYGLEGHSLGVLLSGLIGITIDNAKNDYITGKNNSMSIHQFETISNFTAKTLPRSYILDLTKKRTVNSEYERFVRTYKEGDVILLINKWETGLMAEKIREFVASKMGFPTVCEIYGTSTRMK